MFYRERCSLSQSETLRPLLQKSPLAFPLHKFHQSDQSERIAFRASFFHSHSGVWSHTYGCTRIHRHTTEHYTKVFLHAFSIALHMCQKTVQISWKSLISTGWTVHQFLMNRLKLKRQCLWEKAKPVYYCCSTQRKPCISRVRHVSRTVSVSFNFSDRICSWRIQALVVNAASEVTNHHTTPHPCCSAARPCRKQRGASPHCLLQMCMIIKQS